MAMNNTDAYASTVSAATTRLSSGFERVRSIPVLVVRHVATERSTNILVKRFSTLANP